MRKKIIVVISIVLLIVIIGGICLFTRKKEPNGDSNATKSGYDKILEIVNNKEDGVIYYYNSRSNNKNNKEIKEYLDELNIKYYAYDDTDVDKEEYKKFLTLVGISDDVFGMPALIYIEGGEVRGNIINIDSKDIVKSFIDDYGLYTVQ